MKYNAKLKSRLDSFLLAEDQITTRKMFDYPAYFVGKKLAICHYHNGIAVKLAEQDVHDLMKKSTFKAEPFRPMGKHMGKNWIILFPELSQINKLEDICRKSVNYVKQINSKN